MEEEEKQVETSPTLERKRAKYTVEGQLSDSFLC